MNKTITTSPARTDRLKVAKKNVAAGALAGLVVAPLFSAHHHEEEHSHHPSFGFAGQPRLTRTESAITTSGTLMPISFTYTGTKTF